MECVWRLGDLCREAGLFCPDEAAEQRVCGMTDDSRQVRDGWLFMAVVGFHADGRQYAADAVARGAVAVVWDDSRGDAETRRRVRDYPYLSFTSRMAAVPWRICGARGTVIRSVDCAW